MNQYKKLKNVKIMYEMQVLEILVDEEKRITGVKCKNKTIIKANKVILATGGKSYPITGSTGDGYEMARKKISMTK